MTHAITDPAKAASQLKAYIDGAQKVVFFGGAGVSTASGIPDFRSEDGLYHQHFKYPPETMLGHQFFCEHTAEFYEFYRERMIALDAKPNQAHRKLAELEAAGKLTAVVTQNIDGLHQRAGSRNVIEVHGTILTNTCEKCFATYDAKTLLTLASPVPHCPSCGGVIKPDVVLYEEALDTNDIDEAIDEISKADMLIIGGTSLVVYPAAGFVTYFRGDALVVINQDATAQDARADLVFHDSVGKVLEMAVEGD